MSTITSPLSRADAWKKLNELIDNQNLIKHSLAVECAMLAYTRYFNIPEAEHGKWAVAGLLHDADWEKYPDKHPAVIVAWLKKHHWPEDIQNAISSHGYHFGVAPTTRMAKTLRAVDELTGLIVAVALVKGKSLARVSGESVAKKWRDKSFAKGVSRSDIERGADEIGIPLKEHIAIVLAAMQENAADLGL